MRIIVITMLLLSLAHGEKPYFPISFPNEPKVKKATAHIKPYISNELAILINHFSKPKDPSLIKCGDAAVNLRWRVEQMIVVSPDLVSICFTEGHVVVYGVFVRNEPLKRWDLKLELHGVFSIKTFEDPPEKKSG